MAEDRPPDESATGPGSSPDAEAPLAPGREADTPRPDWPPRPVPASKRRGFITVVVTLGGGFIAFWFIVWLLMGGGIR